MKTIPDKFSKGGFEYELIKRAANVAIYKQYSQGCLIGLEVVCIRKHKKSYSRMNIIAGNEYLPSSSEWGLYGFSYMAFTDKQFKEGMIKAEKKFNKLLTKNK